MKRPLGFTIIELLFVTVLIATASILFFVQKDDFEVAARDEKRKIAINAMYYSLEEVYYKNHTSYPRTLSEDTLPSVDGTLFTDPNGIELGQTTIEEQGEVIPVESDYRYEGTDCSGDACKSYTLRAIMENEDDYVKTSRN